MKTVTLLIGLFFGLCPLVDAKPAIFAPDSFWYQPIPKEAPLHANSAQFVTEFLRQKKAYYGTVNINTRAYSCPIYVVGNDVKTIEVTEWDGQHKGIKDPSLAEQWRAVPIPRKKEPNRIPEGLRFRLDPAVDVEALDLSPAGKIIARAAQKYGFVVWDKAGAICLRADNPKAYTQHGEEDPYPRLFGGKPEWSILQGFPWEKLQFLPVDYGKPKGR